MSATNRGATRREADFYSTPIKSFNPLLPFLPKDKLIWECCCGQDRRLVNRMNEYGLKADGDDLCFGYNFLNDTLKREVIISNPPFGIAKPIITHALSLSDDVYMLLRLSFLESKERRGWWQKTSLARIFILSERPNFVMHIKCKNKECGHKQFIPIESERPKTCSVCNGNVSITTSDAASYAWFHFSKEKYDQFIRWL